MVLETWGTVPHTSAEKKIEIEAKSKKLSTLSSFHNTSDLAGYLYGKLWENTVVPGTSGTTLVTLLPCFSNGKTKMAS